MVTTATPKAKVSADIPEIAQKVREQLLSTVQQAQKSTIEAAQAWAKASSVFPTSELPTVPGLSAIPGAEAVTKYTFDVVTDLLNAQRDFAIELAKLLTPEKTA